MEKQAFYSRFLTWLTSPEVFGSISKKIPGNWILYEYYVDEGENLLNFKADQLKTDNQSMVLFFKNDGTYSADVKIHPALLKNAMVGQWSVARNYITLADPKDFRNNLEFQFAFEKGNLKLLKKDRFGKIEFFGFFRPESQKK